MDEQAARGAMQANTAAKREERERITLEISIEAGGRRGAAARNAQAGCVRALGSNVVALTRCRRPAMPPRPSRVPLRRSAVSAAARSRGSVRGAGAPTWWGQG